MCFKAIIDIQPAAEGYCSHSFSNGGSLSKARPGACFKMVEQGQVTTDTPALPSRGRVALAVPLCPGLTEGSMSYGAHVL